MRLFYLLPLTALLVSCSSMDSGSSPQFFGKAVPAQNESPLPVEIARQIQIITEEGAVVYKNDFLKLDNSAKDQVVNCVEANNCILKLKHGDSEEVIANSPSQTKAGENEDVALSLSGEGPLSKNYNNGQQSGPLGSLKPSGNLIVYKVKKGDTLMEIAFEKYADYLKWRDIYRHNKKKIPSPKRMQIGTNLDIHNYKPVSIRKVGKPYLIKKSDTLKSISKKLYGTEDRWKDLWKNNPELIKNPKKIYYGFTLYHVQDDEAVNLRNPAEKKDLNDTL